MTSPLVQALAYQNSVSPSQSGIAPTDVVGAYKLSSDVAEKNYQAQLAAQQAKFGGLAGLGGAGVLAFGPSLAKKYFAAGLSPTSPTAATAAPGAAADAGTAASGTAVSDAGAAAGLPTFGVDALGAGGGGSVAADLGLGGGAADAAGAGSVAADLGLGGAGAAGLGAGADAAGAAGTAAVAGLPDWLASMLPFLALA